MVALGPGVVVAVLVGSDRVGTAPVSASAAAVVAVMDGVGAALAGVSAGALGLLIGPGAFAIGSFGCDDGVGAGGRAGIDCSGVAVAAGFAGGG